MLMGIVFLNPAQRRKGAENAKKRVLKKIFASLRLCAEFSVSDTEFNTLYKLFKFQDN